MIPQKKLLLACLAMTATTIIKPTCLLGDTANLLPVADTSLRSSVPDNNFGAVAALTVGVSGSFFTPPTNYYLVRFDLTTIPVNAVVTSATLQLVFVSNPSDPVSFDLNRLLNSWGEGTNTVPPNLGGSVARIGDATWNSRLHLVAAWDAPGGLADSDYVSTPSFTSTLSSATNQLSTPGITADVQLWIQNPGTNFGWIFLASGGIVGTGKQIASREDTARSPILTVEYTLPSLSPPPTPPTLFGFSAAAGQIHFSVTTQSNLTYTVESRDSLTDGNWNLLTNIPAQSIDGTVDIFDGISSDHRFYRARTP
jgi:hypothetical protein